MDESTFILISVSISTSVNYKGVGGGFSSLIFQKEARPMTDCCDLFCSL